MPSYLAAGRCKPVLLVFHFFMIANAVKWIFYNRKIVCKMAEGTTIKIAVKKPLRFGLLLQGKGINQKKF